MNHKYYKSDRVEVKLTSNYLTVQISKDIEFATLSQDEHFSDQSIWIIKIQDESIGIYCTDVFPLLEQASVIEHRDGDHNSLRIPFGERPVLTGFKYWLRKPRYSRPKWVKEYWQSKLFK